MSCGKTLELEQLKTERKPSILGKKWASAAVRFYAGKEQGGDEGKAIYSSAT
jgi:hypothetical protein